MAMRRRRFLAAGSSALTLAAAGARAEIGRGLERPFRIYMILHRGETEVEDGFMTYFRDRGIPAEYLIRSIERDRDKVAGFVAEAKELRPDLVYLWGTPVTVGAVGEHDQVDPVQHITDLPVVFTMVSSPDGSRVVESLASSERNLTGVTHNVPLDAQIRAMRAYRPLRRLAVIYTTDESNSVVNVNQLRRLSREMDFELIDQPVPMDSGGRPDPATLPELIAAVASREPQFLYIGPDNFVGVHRDLITQEGIQHGLPAFTATELEIRHSYAMIGLIASYFNVGRFTAYKAEQILVGRQDPRHIPIETLARFTYLIKMSVVHQLKMYPPMSVLNYAEVI
jgi:putative tryptophan/tyrosine transport system substrate-binding protein